MSGGRLASGLALCVLLGACVGAPAPRTSVAQDPQGFTSCRSPIAVALAIRNGSEDSPNERRELPC